MKGPIHFFTIVLNGMPFIRYHVEVFKQLNVDWHWHIVEGVASLTKDTAWSVSAGGKIPAAFKATSLSTDGTTEYLDELSLEFPGKVSIYRKAGGVPWNGKLEMVSAPLQNILEPCLLWQIDVDEFWTPRQIEAAADLFSRYPSKSAAYFFCVFFVSARRVISTLGTYGNHLDYEWLRLWRFLPGDSWASHEPPRLCRSGDPSLDVASLDPFRQVETLALGLVFEHFAYVFEEQVRFKEDYYGYRGAVAQWKSMQALPESTIRLRDHFPWVSDESLAVTIPLDLWKPLLVVQDDGTHEFAFHDWPSQGWIFGLDGLALESARWQLAREKRLAETVQMLEAELQNRWTVKAKRFLLPSGSARHRIWVKLKEWMGLWRRR